jgi:hypothetical protein
MSSEQMHPSFSHVSPKTEADLLVLLLCISKVKDMISARIPDILTDTSGYFPQSRKTCRAYFKSGPSFHNLSNSSLVLLY